MVSRVYVLRIRQCFNLKGRYGVHVQTILATYDLLVWQYLNNITNFLRSAGITVIAMLNVV